MKIPGRVKIGGHIYRVRLVDRVDESDSDGALSDITGVIEISSQLTPTAQACTFIHEALHGMNTTIDHVLLDSLAEQMFQFLHDNDLLK